MRKLPRPVSTALIVLLGILFSSFAAVVIRKGAAGGAWIRINQLGYPPNGIKAGVWVSKSSEIPQAFDLVDSGTKQVVFSAKTGKSFGAYGPFTQSLRLDFSGFCRPGSYFLKCGEALSPVFRVDANVYAGIADFELRYLRQQRSGFNPFLKDSCHTRDGYTMYGPMPDSTRIDVWGGWHDATDYLQYVTTSANATYHLLAAARDFPGVFSDHFQGNGLAGSNGRADVLDEATWGLQWLLKMHPNKDWMFNQLADDRDHYGFRLPDKDSADYGFGPGGARPVYFASGRPQGLGKFQNHSTGVASTAGKFASAFALGSLLYRQKDAAFAGLLQTRALSAYRMGLDKPGVCQTAPKGAPYFYEEENWTDDMELAAAALFSLTGEKDYRSAGIGYSRMEPVTPWLGADTARHYQWYPFHNFGHYELGKNGDPVTDSMLADDYRQGIERVWRKAAGNAFYRGVPFIWCSNNLNTSFAIQCFLYRSWTGDNQYAGLEQSAFDWLFGCNPWGISMICGLPGKGTWPVDPHSSFSILDHYPLDGAMVDGPVYGSIFRNLRSLKLTHADAYAEFQSDFVVYHDDQGDYSTNEPTMDGTASLVYLAAAKESEAWGADAKRILDHGAIVRGDSSVGRIALVFTGDEFADGAKQVVATLEKEKIKASFFLTGNFLRKSELAPVIRAIKRNGHYISTHSDKHLLYCDWQKRDSLLVTKAGFDSDLSAAFDELKKWGVEKDSARIFLPPYEWYNDSVARWAKDDGLQLVNYTPGTRSNADYSWPSMGKHYLSSDSIVRSIYGYEGHSPSGLNGHILLLHLGTDPRRKDKLYSKLDALIDGLKKMGYRFVRIDQLPGVGDTAETASGCKP